MLLTFYMLLDNVFTHTHTHRGKLKGLHLMEVFF
jgi:hypothetical protein